MGKLTRLIDHVPRLTARPWHQHIVHGSESRSADLREEARGAVARRELSLLYQPIYRLPTGRLEKVEALLRWTHPMMGEVEPRTFIPVLEDAGLISSVGRWVLDEACMQVTAWRTAGLVTNVALNISPLQLEHGDFPSSVQDALRRTGCRAEWLELEITEGQLVTNFALARREIQKLGALGCTVAIDDFGTGYSSLGQLAELPVHHLKIDRSLIAGIERDAKRTSIVQAITAMAEALQLGVTIEGVETAPQAAFIERFAPIHAQGFFFGAPMSALRICPYAAFAEAREIWRPGKGVANR